MLMFIIFQVSPRCGCPSLYDKRDFEDVINVKDSSGNIILDYLGGSNVITQIFKSKEPFLTALKEKERQMS